MIRLTDVHTNKSMYIDELRIISVVPVKASEVFKLHASTRIKIYGDDTCFHATESPDEVMAAIPLPKPVSKDTTNAKPNS